MHSLYEGTFLQAELLSLSCCWDTNRVVEVVVVQFVQLSFVNAFDRTSIQCFQISSQGSLIHSFNLFARLKQDQNIFPALESLRFFISWWTSASGDLASDEALLMNLLLMTSSLQEHFVLQEHFSSDASSFLFVDSLLLSSILPEPYKDIKFCLWSCTLEQILAYPIDNF